MWKFIFWFFVLAPVAIAGPVDFNRAIYDFNGDVTHFKNVINFHLDNSAKIEISLPNSFDNLSIKNNEKILDYDFIDGKAVIDVFGSSEITIEYDTNEFVKDGSFVADFETPYFSNFAFLEFWFNDNYVLRKISPDARGVIKEDGKVKVKWQLQNLDKGTRLFAVFEKKNNLGYFVMPIFTIIVIIYFLINHRKP